MELSFAEDLGSCDAATNNQIEELNRRLGRLDEELARLELAQPDIPPVSPDVREQRVGEAAAFAENSQYAVLVFNRPEPASRDTAKAVTETLVKQGYRSSRIESDFTELKKGLPPGNVYITRSRNGEAIYLEVERLIEGLDLGVEVSRQVGTQPLRRGDVQVLVF